MSFCTHLMGKPFFSRAIPTYGVLPYSMIPYSMIKHIITQNTKTKNKKENNMQQNDSKNTIEVKPTPSVPQPGPDQLVPGDELRNGWSEIRVHNEVLTLRAKMPDSTASNSQHGCSFRYASWQGHRPTSLTPQKPPDPCLHK